MVTRLTEVPAYSIARKATWAQRRAANTRIFFEQEDERWTTPKDWNT